MFFGCYYSKYLSNIIEVDARYTSATSSSQPISSTVNFARYENSSFGMKMDYPADWKKSKTTQVVGLEMEMSR